jgi:drug/metabolite transporter (DMT)-like permease
MATLAENTRGAGIMMASMAAFTLNDTCMKALADHLPFFQVLFLRGLATSLIMGIAVWVMGGLRFDLSARDWRFVGLRTFGELIAAYFFLTALFHLPIANFTAVLQALPLTVTLAGAVFWRDKVGWRRLSAILVGFVGVVLIIRPGPEGFNLFALYALLAVAGVTVRDLATRGISKQVPSLLVAWLAALAVTAFAGIGAMGVEWKPLTTTSVTLLAGSVFFIIGGYTFSVMVMRVGDISFIAPFRYTGLLWALLLGLLVFGEWPDQLTLLGAGIVVATGLFTFYREHSMAKATKA